MGKCRHVRDIRDIWRNLSKNQSASQSFYEFQIIQRKKIKHLYGGTDLCVTQEHLPSLITE